MKIAATELVQLLVCEALPFAKMLLGEIVDRNACGPGIFWGPGRPARTIAAAGKRVRRRLLVAQIEPRGNCSASPVKLAASEQSHERSSWPQIRPP
jgi:hypothetical protein